jgi:SAM-dependent methyltransferase
VETTAFVLSQLPPPPARVLEAGTGQGTLAVALAAAGYDVVAVDPAAPKGEIFRPIKLEEIDDEPPFDAVVMSMTLHHVADLGVALDKVVELLRPGGLLVLDDFAHDRLDETTADWFYGQRRALAAARGTSAPSSLDAFRREWEEEHVGLHGYDAMRAAVDERFRERGFSWEPFLYRFLEDAVAAESLERTLVDADAIRAIGFRYVGTPG